MGRGRPGTLRPWPQIHTRPQPQPSQKEHEGGHTGGAQGCPSSSSSHKCRDSAPCRRAPSTLRPPALPVTPTQTGRVGMTPGPAEDSLQRLGRHDHIHKRRESFPKQWLPLLQSTLRFFRTPERVGRGGCVRSSGHLLGPQPAALETPTSRPGFSDDFKVCVLRGPCHIDGSRGPVTWLSQGSFIPKQDWI